MREEKKAPEKPESKKPEVEEEFRDLIDLEYIEMIELIEMEKKGELTQEQLKKLQYIRKTRENLFGGDA